MEYHHESVAMEYACTRLNLGWRVFFAIWILLCCSVFRGVASSDCYMVAKGGLKHAQCDNKGFQTVPQDLSHDVKVLELNDNEISFLQLDTFKRYKSLQQIFLARNRIEEIAADAFRHLDNLQRLDLESNRLKFVPSRAFKHLHSVRELIMKGNPITLISYDAFQYLKNIEVLDFENCWLNRIDARAFHGLNNLKEINLVNNDLSTLQEEMQYSLPESLFVFRLYRNPWNCDCKLRWLLEWLLAGTKRCKTGKCINWHFHTNTPMCKEPEMINDITWVNLEPNRFACASDIKMKNSTYYLVVGASITIECEVDGDPPPEVTWEKGSQVIDEFTDSSKYKVHVEKNGHKLWSRLTVLNANHSDTGEYKCTAKNLAGQSSVTYVVREPLPPPVAPKKPSSKGLSLSIIIAIAVGSCCVLVLIIACSVYLICRNYNRRHAYKVRNYKTPSKSKQQKNEKARFDDEEQAIVKENDKRVASAASQLLEKKKKEQEKELVKEFYKETDIATGPIVCNDVHENSTTDQKGKEFKMKIFTKYEDEEDERTRAAADLPSPVTESARAAANKNHKPKEHCNNIKEVTPDLLKTQQQQTVPNHTTRPTEPNHIQSCLKKRAEENPYAKPSDLRPGATLPKKQSRSAEDLLDASRDNHDCRSRPLAGSHSPNLRHRHDKHDTSPCSNPICLKDQDAGGRSPTGLPKPHIKTSQSMGGIQGKAADDSCIGQTGKGQPSGRSADKYATLPSKPRQGILHNGNPSRTTTYGVRFPDDTPGSPPSNPSKTHTYQHHQTGRPAKSQLVHHVSPTRTPIPKYHPQIIRGTNTATSSGRLPPKHGSRVTSPASSEHSGEFSPQRPSKAFTSTSLDDILSPPFGNNPDRPKNSKKSQKLPKPGEKDEFGTAV